MASKLVIFAGLGGIAFAMARRLKLRGHELQLVGRNVESLAAPRPNSGPGTP